jgi:hypothetical protein
MPIDPARVSALVRNGLEQAGVRLAPTELAQLESLTAAMLEGLEHLDELNPALDQADPALTFAVATPESDE